jgi:hypothetical protein
MMFPPQNLSVWMRFESWLDDNERSRAADRLAFLSLYAAGTDEPLPGAPKERLQTEGDTRMLEVLAEHADEELIHSRVACLQIINHLKLEPAARRDCRRLSAMVSAAQLALIRSDLAQVRDRVLADLKQPFAEYARLRLAA